MTDGSVSTTGDDVIPVEQLSTSYRFDDELAAFLTEFQYRDDGITLTAAESRPHPEHVYDAPTDGVETVFEAGGSLAIICYEGHGHRMVNPIETAIVGALADALDRSDTADPAAGRRWGPAPWRGAHLLSPQTSLEPGSSDESAVRSNQP